MRALSRPSILHSIRPIVPRVLSRSVVSRNNATRPRVSRQDPHDNVGPHTKRFLVGLFAGLSSAAIYYIGFYFLPPPAINPQTFTPYTLTSKQSLSTTGTILTLRPSLVSSRSSEIYVDAWKKGVWSVQIKQPQLQIARSYTPLPPTESSDNAELRFLIRRDPQGEVSEYLHRLPVGASIDLRGPQLEYEIPNDVREVLFLAGGTGIAPALQVAYTLFHWRGNFGGEVPRMRILWANRKREDAVGGGMDDPIKASAMAKTTMVQALDSLKSRYSGRINVDYFVDEEKTFISKEIIRASLENAFPASTERRLILISGPEGFVKHHAGAKTWQKGRETQGRLGGLLEEIGAEREGWEIWKL